MRFARWLCGWVLVATLIATGGATLPAQTATESFSDSFHNTTLDRTRWIIGKINVNGDVTATTEGLQLRIRIFNPGPFYALTVWLNCRIPADFDAQVSYRVVDWPIANGIRLGLGVHPNPLPLGSTSLHGLTGNNAGLRTVISERASVLPRTVTTYPNGGEFYTAELNGRESRLLITSDRAGKIRVTRVGNDFTAWYWDAASRIWFPSGRWTLNADVHDAEWIALQLWGYQQSPEIKILFENFSVSAATLSCP